MPDILEFRPYSLPLLQPVRTAHGLWSQREGILVRVRRTDGSFGYGEAAPIPWFGTETAAEAVSAAQGLGLEVQVTPGLLERIPQGCPCLRNAVSAALAPGNGPEPAPARRASLGVAALLPAGPEAVRMAEMKAEAGFRVFKWKVGVRDADEELGWLDELCSILPSGSRLRLDANGAWDRRRAARWLERCAERPVEFVEQPVPQEARDLLLGLAGDTPVAIGLDESIASDADIEVWIAEGWNGIYVVKPSLLAAPSESMARLKRARARVVFSSALETRVGARLALDLAFAWEGEPLALGFGVWPLFSDPRFDGPMALPFLTWAEVMGMDLETTWNASS